MFEIYRNLLRTESLLDIIEEDVLRQLIAGFYYKQNAGVVLVYKSKRVSSAEEYSEVYPIKGDFFETGIFNPFCKRFRQSSPHRNQQCVKCDHDNVRPLFAGRENTETRYTCHMGLFDIKYPIKVCGRVMGVLLAGQRIDKDDPKQLEVIQLRVTKRAPEIEAELMKDARSRAQTLAEIEHDQEAFERLADVVEHTATVMFNAKKREAISEAVVEASNFLSQSLNTNSQDWITPVEKILAEAETLMDGQKLCLLVRRNSKYRMLATTPSTLPLKDLGFPVVDFMRIPKDQWQEPSGNKLCEQVNAHIREKRVHVYRISSPGAIAVGLSVVLCLIGNPPKHGKVFLQQCCHSIAHVANNAALFDRLKRQQEEFARSVIFAGHQLKTPIQSALFSLFFLLREVETNPGVSPTGLRAELKETLESLTNSMNDARQLQTANYDTTEDVDLYKVLEELVPAFRPIGAAKKVRIDMPQRPNEPCVTTAAKFLIRIAIQNILDNAIKYSFREKFVSIQIGRLGPDDILVEIANYGTGFNEEEGQNIFSLGTRVDHDPNVVRHGAGIGLAQAKDYVERFGGTISIESKPQTDMAGLRHLTKVIITMPAKS